MTSAQLVLRQMAINGYDVSYDGHGYVGCRSWRSSCKLVNGERAKLQQVTAEIVKEGGVAVMQKKSGRNAITFIGFLEFLEDGDWVLESRTPRRLLKVIQE